MVGNVNVLEQTAYFPSGPVEIVYQKSENDLKLVSQVPITHGMRENNYSVNLNLNLTNKIQK